MLSTPCKISELLPMKSRCPTTRIILKPYLDGGMKPLNILTLTTQIGDEELDNHRQRLISIGNEGYLMLL